MSNVSGSLKLSVYTPSQTVCENREVSSVTLTGSEGQIQILPGHASMLGTLEPGVLATDGGERSIKGKSGSGFFEVTENEVSVVAESLELAE